jgi:hypothetical protein
MARLVAALQTIDPNIGRSVQAIPAKTLAHHALDSQRFARLS